MTTISHPPVLPLALRADGYGDTAKAARGFGAAAAASIEKIEAAFESLVSKLGDGLPARAPDAGNRVALRAPDAARIARAAQALPPAEGGKRLSGEAALLALVGQLAQSMDSSSLAELKANSKLRKEQLQQRAAQGERLNQALEAAREAELAAGQQADATAEAAQQALLAAEAARAEVQRLQQELEGMDPNAPGYADKEAALASARQTQTQTAAASEQAAADALSAAKAYDKATEEHNNQLRAADQFNRENPLGLRPPEAGQMANRSARMQALIGLLSQIMSDASLDKLRNESESALQQLQANQKESLRLAEEQEKELERQREAESKSGCFGKIFGWIGKALAAIGSVVAIAVGVLIANPAMVVAGVVGLALTIDQIQAEITGFSVMGKVTEALGGVIAKALVAMGVDEELAQQIGSFVAVVVVMVAIIAAMVATGNIGAATSQVGKMALLAKQASEAIQVMAQAANLASATALGIGKIIVADIQIDIAELLASLENLLFSDDVLRELLAMVEAVVTQMNKTGLDLMKHMSDMLHEEASTAKAIIAHVRTA